jgi:hypothetical protein
VVAAQDGLVDAPSVPRYGLILGLPDYTVRFRICFVWHQEGPNNVEIVDVRREWLGQAP